MESFSLRLNEVTVYAARTAAGIPFYTTGLATEKAFHGCSLSRVEYDIAS